MENNQALTFDNLSPQQREVAGMLKDFNEDQIAALRDLLKSIISQNSPTQGAAEPRVRQFTLDI